MTRSRNNGISTNSQMLCDYGHAEILLTTSSQNPKRLRNERNPTARSRHNSGRVNLYADEFIVTPTTTGHLNAPLFLQLKNEKDS